MRIPDQLNQRNYLEVLNGLFRLTPQEMEVLRLLIEADPLVPCSRKARRFVQEKMEFKTTIVVSNYIGALKSKQAIIQTVDGYKFNPMLIPSPEQDSIEIIWEQL